ncbi:hypothetical protein A9K97_gp054 [Tokyovirus A1]|uniref:hypothetical protein n=1 Tax=Tokyovirus A1 TaxID=1826170 RepID=UPI0007A95EA3|nr:hypothetical protein A9K97_gp054 [Tokyovirus A1]BAU80297.1 hypothetical protein [Tokyovirus A1]
MQSFFKNGEYISFCLSEGVPPLKEQRDRFLKREECMAPSRIGNELLKLVVSELNETEKKALLGNACETEDIERFGTLTSWKGNTKYIAENDDELFSPSADFYCDMFERDMLSTVSLVKFVENDKDKLANIAYLLSSMLQTMKERRRG